MAAVEEDAEEDQAQPKDSKVTSLGEKVGLPRFAARRGASFGPSGALRQSNWGGDFDADSTDDDGVATDTLAAALTAAQGAMGPALSSQGANPGVLSDRSRSFASMRAMSTVAAALMQSEGHQSRSLSDAQSKHFHASRVGSLHRAGVNRESSKDASASGTSTRRKPSVFEEAASFIADADESPESQQRHEYRHGLGSGRQCSALGICGEDGSCRCRPGYGGESC